LARDLTKADGTRGDYKAFDVVFENAIDHTWCVAEGVFSARSLRNTRIRNLVQGYDDCARPPCPETVTRISEIIYDLMRQKQRDYVEELGLRWKCTECASIQFDMWSDNSVTPSVSYIALVMCTIDSETGRMREEVLSMESFGSSAHTGACLLRV
jgi:hypothetical protein